MFDLMHLKFIVLISYVNYFNKWYVCMCVYGREIEDKIICKLINCFRHKLIKSIEKWIRDF
jgi:hypothetical protein